ncbi:MAG: hypothetical protein WA144_11145 [Candidatus Methanoperedens sp.]
MFSISSISIWLVKNKINITKNIFILMFLSGLLFFIYGQPPSPSTSLLKDLVLAILIGVIVRTINWGLSEEKKGAELSNSDLLKEIKSEIAPIRSSLEKTSEYDLRDAIKKAESKVWIYSTWIPGTEQVTMNILNTKANDIRILLASFKEGSPIFARIKGRKFEIETAKHEVYMTAKPFVDKCKADCVRFNYGHHPSWIAVVDSAIYWGPTPVDEGNWQNDFLIHKHFDATREGKWWKAQFELIWKNSHDYSEEKQKYNNKLL